MADLTPRPSRPLSLPTYLLSPFLDGKEDIGLWRRIKCDDGIGDLVDVGRLLVGITRWRAGESRAHRTPTANPTSETTDFGGVRFTAITRLPSLLRLGSRGACCGSWLSRPPPRVRAAESLRHWARRCLEQPTSRAHTSRETRGLMAPSFWRQQASEAFESRADVGSPALSLKAMRISMECMLGNQLSSTARRSEDLRSSCAVSAPAQRPSSTKLGFKAPRGSMKQGGPMGCRFGYDLRE